MMKLIIWELDNVNDRGAAMIIDYEVKMMLMIGKHLNWPRVQIYFSTLCHNRHSVVLHRIVWYSVVLHRILSSVIIQHADGGLHLPSNTALSVLKIHFRTRKY